MNEVKLHIAMEAMDDLQEIWDYISPFDEAAADRTIEAIANAYIGLLDQPAMGRRRDDLLSGLRSIVVGKYVVFYCFVDNAVIVSRILHGARDHFGIFHS